MNKMNISLFLLEVVMLLAVYLFFSLVARRNLLRGISYKFIVFTLTPCFAVVYFLFDNQTSAVEYFTAATGGILGVCLAKFILHKLKPLTHSL